MKGNYILLAIALAVIATFVVSMTGTTAQTTGCCCNESGGSQSGPALPSYQCDIEKNFTFHLPDVSQCADTKTICTCDCRSIEHNITYENITQACGDPDFRPPVYDLTSEVARGDRKLQLTWKTNCTDKIDIIRIKRCAKNPCGTAPACKEFPWFPNETTWIDSDPELEYVTNYTYNVTVSYKVYGDSQPATTSVYTGDLECDGMTQESEQFCLSLSYYNREDPKLYLMQFGYVCESNTLFRPDKYSQKVNSTFYWKTNAAYQCMGGNRLTLVNKCPASQNCIVRGGSAGCTSPDPCGYVTSPHFGLNITQAECETNQSINQPRYCFFDRSASLIDFCYNCFLGMQCLDYHSADACTRDNCQIKNCEWRNVFPDFGIGVCINTKQNNCYLCDVCSSETSASSSSCNQIFDTCTKSKSDQLSTPQYPCFYDKNQQTSRSCLDAACIDYSEEDCKAPTLGIHLDWLNNIDRNSSDACGIGRCQYSAIYNCSKNADGIDNLIGDFRDCANVTAANRRACEQDYFPPVTTIFPVTGNNPGVYDSLIIQRMDRLNKRSTPTLVSGTTNPLHYCVYPDGETMQSCVKWNVTKSNYLDIDNLGLVDGTTIVAPLVDGYNHIAYFTEDWVHNLEVKKDFKFKACSSCQGPRIKFKNVSMSVNLTPDKFRTSSPIPNVTIAFNKATTITFARFRQTNREVSTLASTTDRMNYSLLPATTLAEGTYILRIDAQDDQGTRMVAPNDTTLIVDTTGATMIAFAGEILLEGAVLNKSDNLIKLNFSEPVRIENITVYYDSVDDFSNDLIAWDVTSSFSSNNLRNLFQRTLRLQDGNNVLAVKGTDDSLNPFYYEVPFIVASKAPMIRLALPPYGAAPNYTFDIAVNTTQATNCKYVFNPGAFGVPADWTRWDDFDYTGGTYHFKRNFNAIAPLPENRNIKFPFYVKCKDNLTRPSENQFTLQVQDQMPIIQTHDAWPNPIIQRPYKTTLRVTTNIDTFCKYSNSTSVYANMESVFPGFNQTQTNIHTADVTVPVPARYTYHVACKSISGLGPVNESIIFWIDPNVTFQLTDNTPPGKVFPSRVANISIGSNKESRCLFNIDNVSVSRENDFLYVHGLSYTTPSNGKHISNTTCATGGTSGIGGQMEVATAITPFVTDTNSPRMLYVYSNSTNTDPRYTADMDRLRFMYNGTDDESLIVRYEYIIKDERNGVIQNTTYSNSPDTWLYATGLALTNNTRYYFDVKAVDEANHTSTAMTSPPIWARSDARPSSCSNGVRDGSETDTDCGGLCSPCNNSKRCINSSDCVNLACVNRICTTVNCEDGIKNGWETAIDCGGPNCSSCPNNSTCYFNTDCTSNLCSGGKCKEPTQCENTALDGDETDIDCGGSCPKKCVADKICRVALDCSSGLTCESGIDGISHCVDRNKDSDSDGMPDWYEDEMGLDKNNPSDASTDPDGDSLTSLQEYQYYVSTGRKIKPKVKDTDNDGYPDGMEIAVGTDPTDPLSKPKETDSDGDGMPDDWEKRWGLDPTDPTDAAKDKDGDGMTNLEEYKYFKDTGRDLNPTKADTDGDGFNDKEEIQAGTDPTNALDYPHTSVDTDNDGIPDDWEERYGLDPTDPNDAILDPDGDGLTNLEEYTHYLQTGQDIDPHKKDTDGDGYLDGEEILAGSNPADASSIPLDTDGDGIPDFWERKYGMDVNNANDASEDKDNDGLTNLQEYEYYHSTGRFVDPTDPDTDGDGYNDGKEVSGDSDPTDPSSVPKSNWTWWFWIALLLILIVLGVYYWLTHRQKTKDDEFIIPAKLKAPPSGPGIKTADETKKAKELPAEKPRPKEEKPDFIAIEELSKKKMDEHEAQIFSRLKGLQPGGAGEELPKLTPLQEIALSRFTPEERKDIQKKLELLRQGKLSQKDMEDLFRKLRITAAYWNKNKDRLAKQFQDWLARGVVVKPQAKPAASSPAKPVAQTPKPAPKPALKPATKPNPATKSVPATKTSAKAKK